MRNEPVLLMGCRNQRYWPQPLQQHHHPGILRLILPLFWLAGSTILGLWGFALTRRMSAEIELQYVRQRHYDRGMGPKKERSSRRASVLSAATIPLSSSLQPAVASWHPRIAHTTIHQAREWQSVHRPRSIKHAQTLQYPLLLRPSYSDADTNATVELDRTRLYGLTNASLDFPNMELRRWPVHELDPEHCVPIASWQSHFYPVCNVVHEHSFQEGLTLNSNVSVGIGSEGASDGRLELLSSKGFWRDAWKMDQPTRDGTMTTTVWRTFKMEHDMEEAFFENARVDAVAMERLTFSPYIVNMYGFCGMTVVTEYAPYELSEVALRLNSTERLDMARKVAQGVSDIHHSIEGDVETTVAGAGRARPSLVHNDLNLANLRVSQDGSRPVLNDFNIAVLLMKHKDTGETCPFASRFPNPQWRSPEEQVYSQDETDLHPPVVTEKIDIYALGNVLYRLVVGASPWKAAGAQKLSAEEKMSVAKRKREHGDIPPIPPEVQDMARQDRAVRLMLEAMHQTYRFRPEDRPTAKEVVDLLSSSSHRL